MMGLASENEFTDDDWHKLARSVRNCPELDAIFRFGDREDSIMEDMLPWKREDAKIDYQSKWLCGAELGVLAELLPRNCRTLRELDLRWMHFKFSCVSV